MCNSQRSREGDGKPNIVFESSSFRTVCDSVKGVAGGSIVESERSKAQLRQAGCELGERRVRVRVLTAERRTENDRPAY
jgi:hypothetical protein